MIGGQGTGKKFAKRDNAELIQYIFAMVRSMQNEDPDCGEFRPA